MVNACVFYSIDAGYLLPALVSAIQARANVPTSVADVVIVMVGEPTPASIAASAVAEQYGVQILVRPAHLIDDMHPMYARLFAHRLLPDQYERIVYIDGDTQVRGPLQPLFEAAIPPGRFLAARDPAVVFAQLSEAWLRRIQADRASVGYTRHYAEYFNSGVLVIERSTWPALAAATLEVLREITVPLPFKDQDVLNLAVGDKCTLISNRWNFPGFLIGSELDAATGPSIYHFMSNPRPWVEAVRPWGPAWRRPYLDLLRKHPQLSALTPRRALGRSLRYWLQQELKMALEYRPVGRLAEPPAELLV